MYFETLSNTYEQRTVALPPVARGVMQQVTAAIRPPTGAVAECRILAVHSYTRSVITRFH